MPVLLLRKMLAGNSIPKVRFRLAPALRKIRNEDVIDAVAII
jgi:hypothetical protein